MTEHLMTLAEVSDFLQIPAGTLYQWRSRGTGPRSIKVGKHLRYRPSDLTTWLETSASGV